MEFGLAELGMNVMIDKHQTCPISARYNLDRLQSMLERDISRLQKLLQRIERDESQTRLTTASTYRQMIADRQAVLEDIRQQSQQFRAKAVI